MIETIIYAYIDKEAAYQKGKSLGLEGKDKNRLIGDLEKNYQNYFDGYKYLKRLPVEAAIPKGYMKVSTTFNRSVYDNEGRLLPKFQALEIYNEG